MGETPNIVMQCPKCNKEFPFDTNYCEDCTAMLEPIEREPTTPAHPSEASSEFPVESSAASSDQIEDVRIDSLKTDIEESFVSTLLYELNRLRERMEKKEAALSDLYKQQSDTSSPDLIQEIGRAETEVNNLLKRSARIEAILENLKKKLEADIAGLNAEIGKTDHPGLFGFFSASGRYFSMLSSELRVKKALLTAIETKTYNKRKWILKYAFVFGMLLIIAGLLTYSWLRVSQKTGVIMSSTTSQEPASKTAIQAKDIYDLLEDIKNANMKKDLSLWESRYARQYLDAGKKRNETAENWKKFDYVSLQYKVEDIQMLPERITATISWKMELRSTASGKMTRTTLKLISEFVVEDDTLKIASVRKAGQ
ncbi:MAG: hypothetical protein Q8K68_05610 [Nitrospirota bacterium]|nr:hypothetical protein [Nitrospirota bacterium]